MSFPYTQKESKIKNLNSIFTIVLQKVKEKVCVGFIGVVGFGSTFEYTMRKVWTKFLEVQSKFQILDWFSVNDFKIFPEFL